MHEGEGFVLDEIALADELISLPGWEPKNKQISKVYTFETFDDAMEFANQIADVARELNHHPDIHINFKKVKIYCATHKYNAVTKADTELAARVDKVYEAG